MPARDESAERNLECSYCGRLFRFKWQLSEHIRRHENKTPHKCNLCPKAFVKNSDLTTHMRSHSDEKLFKCKHCDRHFKSRQGKLFHEDNHGFNSYKCPKCTEVFHSYLKLFKHRKSHINVSNESNGISSYMCSYCFVTFSTLEFKKRHESDAHRKRDEINAASPKAKKSKVILKSKTFKCESIKIPPFSCSACDETFPGSTSLSKHIKTEHPGEKLFYQRCTLCQKNISLNYFRPHIMSHYNIRPFECNICTSKFVRNHDLQHHMTSHSGVKPFECLECHKKFQSIKCLSRHKRSHHSRIVYTCNICEKMFIKKARLKDHISRVHSKSEKKERCYKCNIEVFSFDIKNHVKKHHDTDRRLCEICGLSFRNLWSYRSHLRTCNKIKERDPFATNLLPIKALTVIPCPHCSHLSQNKSTLKKHCLRYHPEEIFNCQICSKTSLCMTSYKIHLRKHTNDLNYEGIAFYECCFCGFIPISYGALEEHLQTHEFFKWMLSWNNYKSSNDSPISISNTCHGTQHTNNRLSRPVEDKYSTENSLFINIKKEISWIHDSNVKKSICHKPSNLKCQSSKNSNKILDLSKIKKETANLLEEVNNTIEDDVFIGEVEKPVVLEINYQKNEVIPSLKINDRNQNLLIKSEDKLNFLFKNSASTKTVEKCDERPFIYIDDLKKLNDTDLKSLLKNL